VVTVGSDMVPRVPRLEQVTERCGPSPQQWRVQGGYPAPEPLEAVAPPTEVYAPVPKPKDAATDPPVPKPTASEAARSGGNAWERSRPRPST
jgi:hypothetical protein